MNNFLSLLAQALQQVQTHLSLTLGFIAILYGIQIINQILGYRLNILGIHPRNVFGLIGIPCSPFLHGNWQHLILNTLPLFIFSNFILLQGEPVLIHATVMIILLSGFLTWALGRRAIHVGASGLIMGYLGYITINVYLNPNPLSIVVALVTIFYFGAMFMNLFPNGDKRTSWEGHVFGFIAGMITMWLM